jgi:hypothetical protein
MSEATKAAYLTDTNISDLQNGQRLIYNGTEWVNTVQQDISKLIELSDISATNVAASGIGNLAYDSSIGKFTYTPPEQTLNNLTDTNLSTLQDGQGLIYNGTNWANKGPIYASAELDRQKITISTESEVYPFISKFGTGITVADGNTLFTVIHDGWYSISFVFSYVGTISGQFSEATLKVNAGGTTYDLVNQESNTTVPGTKGSFGGSFLKELNAGDTVYFAATFLNNAAQSGGHFLSGSASLVKID